MCVCAYFAYYNESIVVSVQTHLNFVSKAFHWLTDLMVKDDWLTGYHLLGFVVREQVCRFVHVGLLSGHSIVLHWCE